MRLKRKHLFLFFSYLGAAGMFVFGHWLGMVTVGHTPLDSWFPGSHISLEVNFVAAALLFGFFFWVLYISREVFFAVRNFYSKGAKPMKALIIKLSRPNLPPPSGPFPWTITDTKGKSAKLEGTDLQKDAEELDKINYWNWQQLLRSLTPHPRGHLKKVVILGSPDADPPPRAASPNARGIPDWHGSYRYGGAAVQLVKQYFPDAAVSLHPAAVAFEEFEEMVGCLEDIIRELKKEKFDEKDIGIDITGGQKTASIAGATVTLSNRISFQYVKTNRWYWDPLTGDYRYTNDKRDVLTYDVAVYPESPEAH